MRLTILVVFLGLVALSAPVGWYVALEAVRPVPVEGPAPATAAEVAALRAEIDALRARIDGLEGRVNQISGLRPDRSYVEPGQETTDALRDRFAQMVNVAGRRNVNEGLTHATAGYLQQLFGLPREDLTDECQDMTNPKLVSMLRHDDVGPIRVKMLEPAILSLKQIFKNIEVYEPELHARIRSSGSLCVRRIRGSEDAASAHAYGLAVDINIDGVLDTLGDGKSQLGLILLAEFFQREGWYWGAGFGREDSMHFEVSREKLEQWKRRGDLAIFLAPDPAPPAAPPATVPAAPAATP